MPLFLGGAILLVVFGIVPPPWGIALIAGAVVLEAIETLFWYRLLKRRRPKVGVETLVGKCARVINPCRPNGQVLVQGEIWSARCDDGADQDQSVRIRAIKGLNLVVERVS